MKYTTGLLAFGLTFLACSSIFPQEPSTSPDASPKVRQESQNPKLPKFIVDALASPYALRARLHVSRDGTIERAKVCLKREGLPEWTHDLADEKLGKGEDISYEVEVYGDGTEVYEICRQVDCYPQKVSMRRDRNFLYVETGVDASVLPEAVSTTLSKILGFKPEEYYRRDGDGTSEYHISGALLGIPHRARIMADGTLCILEKQLAAELEIGANTKSEPAVK
jgi:hypothetical protein